LSTVTRLCQVRTNGIAAPGDSGSPVFRFVAGAGPNKVSLYGIVFAGNPVTPEFIFSRWTDIVGLLGPIATFNPPPPPPVVATIPPPYNVPPGGLCQWNAGAAGGVPPYTYLWRKDGVVVGTSSTYIFEIDSGTFLLELRVTDSSQVIDWDSRTIVVQGGSNGCPV